MESWALRSSAKARLEDLMMMRKLRPVLLSVVLLPVAGTLSLALPARAEVGASSAGYEIRVMTFNVKVDFEQDASVPAWQDRKDLCAEVVKKAKPDIVGFQETSPNQLAFFQKVLPGFGTVGDLKLTPAEIEYFQSRFPPLKQLGIKTYTDAILMYRQDMFEKLDEGHWWLSPTPEKVSVGFGNIFPRIAVWARLKHKASGRELVVVVTHFDATSPSQKHMATLSHERMQRFLDEKLPIIFLGDFNSAPTDEAYRLLTQGGWVDSYVAGSGSTKTGHESEVPSTLGGGRIDHIFYHGDALRSVRWARLESPDPARALSDHYPVLAVLELKQKQKQK